MRVLTGAALRSEDAQGIPERILPEDLSQAPDHLARYAFAAHWAAGRRVFDLCCGVGYGTNLLGAAGAFEVLGVDVNAEAIAYATRRYGSRTVSFLVGDATGELAVSHRDLVTCFEGIEHVAEAEKLLATIASAMVPTGLAMVSSPNGAHYEGGFSGNPHHVREYTRREFEELLGRFFGDVEIYFQWERGDPRRPLFGSASRYALDTAYHHRPLPLAVLAEASASESEPTVWLALCRAPRVRAAAGPIVA
jgi:SAM-dependent methyltransferase